MNKFDPTSHNITDEKKAELKSLFPEAFTEQGIDFDRLKALLGEVVESGPERYSFTWPGKSEAIRAAQLSSMGTLSPDKESSVDWDTTENLYLEGDNLEILKLLQKSYTGKVKMIYIDPPYNTGKDFVYPDNYGEGLKTYLEYTGQVDGQGKKISTNVETDGRYHSKWLNMMYPRLMLARNLLKEDGIIFLSIDDNEVFNLRKLCDEIFGGDNFVAEFVWIRKKKGAFLSKKVRKMTEYVLCYQKMDNELKFFGEDAYSDKQQPIVKRTNSLKQLIFPANLIKTKLEDGNYEVINNTEQTGVSFLNPFVVKEGVVLNELKTEARYVWTQEFLNEEIIKGTDIFLSTKFGFNVLRHDQEEKTKTPSTLISKENNVGTNEDASMEIANLFNSEMGDVFDYAKPSSLIKYLINIVASEDKNALILDFFAGSGTTAHAVMQLNAEDDGNRKFILSQLPEPILDDSGTRKARYKNIAEIGKERIRLAGVKILEEYADTVKARETPLDTGFKTYRLTSSTFNVWDVKNKDDIQQKLIGATSLIKDNAKEEDVLTELILKSGYGLTEKVEIFTILGKSFYSIADGSLVISLETGLTLDIVRQIAEKKPSQFVAREHGFGSDDVLTNIAQIMKDKGIDFRVL